MKNAEYFPEVRVSIIPFQCVCLSSLISQHRGLYTGEVNVSSFCLSIMHPNPPVAPTDPVVSLGVKDGYSKIQRGGLKRKTLSCSKSNNRNVL